MLIARILARCAPWKRTAGLGSPSCPKKYCNVSRCALIRDQLSGSRPRAATYGTPSTASPIPHTPLTREYAVDGSDRHSIRVAPGECASFPRWLAHTPGCELKCLVKTEEELGWLEAVGFVGDLTVCNLPTPTVLPPGALRTLTGLTVKRCPALTAVHEGPQLAATYLTVESCPALVGLGALSQNAWRSVTVLDIRDCPALTCVPHLLREYALRSLTRVVLWNCSALTSLSTVREGKVTADVPFSLSDIATSQCHSLTAVPLNKRHRLEDLSISRCDRFTGFVFGERVATPPPLHTECWVRICDCPALTTLSSLPGAYTLTVCRCDNLASLGTLPLGVQSSLNIEYCSALASIPPLPSVRYVTVKSCHSLARISQLSLPADADVAVTDCPLLV